VPVLRMSESFVLPVPWHLAAADAGPAPDFTVNEDVPVPFHVILPCTPLADVPLIVYVATSTPEPPVMAGLLQPPKVLLEVCLPALEVEGLNVALVHTVGVAAPAVAANGTINMEPAASATAINRVGTGRRMHPPRDSPYGLRLVSHH
jgi:hypothetical protein